MAGTRSRSQGGRAGRRAAAIGIGLVVSGGGHRPREPPLRQPQALCCRPQYVLCCVICDARRLRLCACVTHVFCAIARCERPRELQIQNSRLC